MSSKCCSCPEAVAVRAGPAIAPGDRIDVTSVIRRHGKDNDRMVCTMGATVYDKDSPSTLTRQPGFKDRVYAPKLYHIQCMNNRIKVSAPNGRSSVSWNK